MTPFTHSLVVCRALAGVDTTKAKSKSSTRKPILSTNVLAMNVCVQPKSNNSFAGVEGIGRVLTMIVVSYPAALACHHVSAPHRVPHLVSMPVQCPKQLDQPASSGPDLNPFGPVSLLALVVLPPLLLVASLPLPLRLGRWCGKKWPQRWCRQSLQLLLVRRLVLLTQLPRELSCMVPQFSAHKVCAGGSPAGTLIVSLALRIDRALMEITLLP